MTKDDLLAALDDPEVRAKILALVDPVRLKAVEVDAVREDAAAAEELTGESLKADILKSVREDIRTGRGGNAARLFAEALERPMPPWITRLPHQKA